MPTGEAFGLMFGLAVFVYFYSRGSVDRFDLGCGLALSALWVYLRWSRVRLSTDGIEYIGTFVTGGSLPWARLARVSSGAPVIPGAGTLPSCMVLVPSDGAEWIVINLEAFGSRELGTLVRYIQSHAPSAVLDEPIEALSRG